LFKSITLTNFQSHIASKIDFTPGINLITGTSDHGKSSIIRALKWVAFNRPDKDTGLRNDQTTEKDEYSVSLETNEGTTVTRYKTDTLNGYRLSTQKEPLKAIRSDVPTEVQDVLCMTDVNLQEQHNPYFLLNDRPGAVAATFNEMIGLAVMDLCVNEAKKDVNQSKSTLKIIDADLDRIDKEISKLIDTTELQKNLLTLEELYKELLIIEHNIEGHNDIISQYNECLQSIENITPLVDYTTKKLNTIDKMYKRWDLYTNKYNAIVSILNTYTTVENTLNKVVASIPIVDINEIQLKYTALCALQDINDNMLTIETQYQEKYTQLSIISTQILAAEEKFNTEFSTYSSCPLCNSVICKDV